MQTDDRKIGIAIPTYNRYEMTIEAFMEVYNDERIESVTIVDDASELETFNKLKSICNKLAKVKLYRNVNNIDCYNNKATALIWSKSDWNILLDSDNLIDRSYIDALYNIPKWDFGTFYTPSFARPLFDFRPYAGITITKENVAQYIDKPMLETCLNAANYFVNKSMYLMAWDGNVDPVTSDTIFIAHNHLKNNGSIQIVNGLEYDHRVHDGSHYKNNVARTPQGFHEQILNNLRQLK